jgi:hypothetical protein
MKPKNVNRSFRVKGNRHLDDKYFNSSNQPYASIDEVLAQIAENERPDYLLVNVQGVDYWRLPNGSFVPKNEYLSIADKAISLVKMADMAALSVIGNSTNGATMPQYIAFSALKGFLGLSKSDIGLANVDNTSDANKPISSATQTALDGKQGSLGFVPYNSSNPDGYITPAALLAYYFLPPEFRIILPSASTVAGRCVTPIELPTGWTVSAGVVDTDLVITHNLHREMCLCSVMSVDPSTFEKANLPIGANYNNFKEDRYSNTITIQGFATVEKTVIIHLFFGQTIVTQP